MAISSITDKPISSNSENTLGIEIYSSALVDFIKDSATPLTIGIQGEWGTGKTSLMNMIREVMENENIACSWVNTWEYSLFKTSRETVTSVLKGLLENLIYYCKSNDYWPKEKEWEEKKAKLFSSFMKVAEFTANVAVKKTTGYDPHFSLDNSECLVSEISLVKKEIQNVINSIVSSDKNPINKVIFFVDDLDRIEPSVAVEILESLKNIFDIDNCVFLLAIDYDVVVKGLEHKFGKKTTENEREFRSFFDKIIQVPFSMPTSDYDIEKLVLDRFINLGFKIDSSIQKDIVQIIKLSVGYVPRSIKRLINSYSLLRRIRLIKDNDKSNDSQQDLLLFMLLSIQITYPMIYRLINRKFEYLKWDKLFAKTIVADLSLLEDIDKENEFLDEEWEQIIWAYCQKETYLKARALSLIELLNLPRTKFKSDDNYLELLAETIHFTSMTSVDDSVELADKKSNPKVKIENFDTFYENIAQNKFNPEILKLIKDLNDYACGFDGVQMQIYKSSIKYAVVPHGVKPDFRYGHNQLFFDIYLEKSSPKKLACIFYEINFEDMLNLKKEIKDFETALSKLDPNITWGRSIGLWKMTNFDDTIKKLLILSYENKKSNKYDSLPDWKLKEKISLQEGKLQWPALT